MRKILFMFMLSFCMTTHAQRVDKPAESYYFYIDASVLGGDTKISFTDKDLSLQYYVLTDDNEYLITFWCLSEFITYMSKRGWEFVDSSIEHGRVILRKLVIKDEDAFEFLNLKTYPYRKKKNKG